MRIAVCRPQVPFAYGGAEIFTDTLVSELQSRGHEADIVSVPFKWYPAQRVLTQAFLWRMVDLTESDGQHDVQHLADRQGRAKRRPTHTGFPPSGGNQKAPAKNARRDRGRDRAKRRQHPDGTSVSQRVADHSEVDVAQRQP